MNGGVGDPPAARRNNGVEQRGRGRNCRPSQLSVFCCPDPGPWAASWGGPFDLSRLENRLGCIQVHAPTVPEETTTERDQKMHEFQEFHELHINGKGSPSSVKLCFYTIDSRQAQKANQPGGVHGKANNLHLSGPAANTYCPPGYGPYEGPSSPAHSPHPASVPVSSASPSSRFVPSSPSMSPVTGTACAWAGHWHWHWRRQ